MEIVSDGSSGSELSNTFMTIDTLGHVHLKFSILSDNRRLLEQSGAFGVQTLTAAPLQVLLI